MNSAIRITILTALALSLAGGSLRAQNVSATWSGLGGNASWTNGNNWAGNFYPGATSGTTNTNSATFNSAVGIDGSDVPITIASGLNIKSVWFDGYAGSYTIGTTGGSALVLTNGSNIGAGYSSSTVGGNLYTPETEIINAPFTYEGSGSLTSDANANLLQDATLDMGGKITSAASTTVTLTGTSTNLNTVSGQIANGAAVTALSKTGAGTWALSNANTFTGNLTDGGGTLVVENGGALGGSGTTTLALGQGAALDYFAGTTDAPLTYAGAMTITTGSGFAFNQSIPKQGYFPLPTTIGGTIGSTTTSSEINVTGNITVAAGTAGSGAPNNTTAFNINVYGGAGALATAPSNTTTNYVLLNGGAGSNLNLAGTVYSLGNVYDNTNFTVGALTESATQIEVAVTGATALTGNAYWVGGLSPVGAFGVPVNQWALSNGSTASNWSTSGSSGATSQALIPGSGVILNFTGNGGSAAKTALGTNMSVQGLVVTDTLHGLGLNADGNTLTVGTGGITVGPGVPLANIGANIALGGAQSFTNNSSTAPLNIGGVVSGANALTTAGNGTIIFSNGNTYSAGTTISGGTVLAENTYALGTGNVAVSQGAALDYLAPTDAPLTLGGTLAITGGAANGATTTIGGSIGGISTSSSEINVAGNATATGAVKVNVYGDNGIAEPSTSPTNYVLVQGGGTSTLNNATYSLGTVYNNTNFTVGGVSATSGQIDASITGATAISNAYWTGGLSGASNVWAASNGSTTSNWVTSIGGSSQALVPGSGANVFISDTGNIATAPTSTVLGANMSIAGLTIQDTVNGLGLVADGNTLTIGAGGITMNSSVPASTIGANVSLGTSQTWTNNSTSPLIISGAVSGPGSLTTAGTIVLGGANSYTGTTTVSSGVLELTNATAIGAGNVSVTVGTSTSSGFEYAASADAPLVIVGNLAIGTVTSGSPETIIGGSIGSTTTSSEILVEGEATGLSSARYLVNVFGENGVTPASGTYNLLQAIGNGGNLTTGYSYGLDVVYNNTNFTVSSVGAPGAYQITATIVSQTALTGNEYWTGSLTGAPTVLSATNGSASTTAGRSNWSLTSNGNGMTTGSLTGLAPGPGVTLNFSSTGTVTTAPTATTLGANMSVAGMVINDGATGLGILADGNTLTLGSVGITMDNGVAASSIGANVALGTNQTWTNNSVNALTVSGNVNGNAALTTAGTGAVVLSGNNTYTGGTTVTAGTLLANNGSGSATGSGSINVTAGTIGGSGTVNPTGTNTFTVSSGGTLAPGTSGNTNTLTLSAAGNTNTSGLLALSGAALTFNLNAGNTASNLSLTSSFANEVTGLSGNTFNFQDLTSGSLALGEYTLIESDDSTTNPFSGVSPGALSGFTLTGLSAYSGDTVQLQLNQLPGTNDYAIQLDIASVPEPSTWALMLSGLAIVMFWQCRRNANRAC
jgi:autotransporter-associated beta strand protein